MDEPSQCDLLEEDVKVDDPYKQQSILSFFKPSSKKQNIVKKNDSKSTDKVKAREKRGGNDKCGKVQEEEQKSSNSKCKSSVQNQDENLAGETIEEGKTSSDLCETKSSATVKCVEDSLIIMEEDEESEKEDLVPRRRSSKKRVKQIVSDSSDLSDWEPGKKKKKKKKKRKKKKTTKKTENFEKLSKNENLEDEEFHDKLSDQDICSKKRVPRKDQDGITEVDKNIDKIISGLDSIDKSKATFESQGMHPDSELESQCQDVSILSRSVIIVEKDVERNQESSNKPRSSANVSKSEKLASGDHAEANNLSSAMPETAVPPESVVIAKKDLEEVQKPTVKGHSLAKVNQEESITAIARPSFASKFSRQPLSVSSEVTYIMPVKATPFPVVSHVLQLQVAEQKWHKECCTMLDLNKSTKDVELGLQVDSGFKTTEGVFRSLLNLEKVVPATNSPHVKQKRLSECLQAIQLANPHFQLHKIFQGYLNCQNIIIKQCVEKAEQSKVKVKIIWEKEEMMKKPTISITSSPEKTPNVKEEAKNDIRKLFGRCKQTREARKEEESFSSKGIQKLSEKKIDEGKCDKVIASKSRKKKKGERKSEESCEVEENSCAKESKSISIEASFRNASRRVRKHRIEETIPRIDSAGVKEDEGVVKVVKRTLRSRNKLKACDALDLESHKNVQDQEECMKFIEIDEERIGEDKYSGEKDQGKVKKKKTKKKMIEDHDDELIMDVEDIEMKQKTSLRKPKKKKKKKKIKHGAEDVDHDSLNLTEDKTSSDVALSSESAKDKREKKKKRTRKSREIDNGAAEIDNNIVQKTASSIEKKETSNNVDIRTMFGRRKNRESNNDQAVCCVLKGEKNVLEIFSSPEDGVKNMIKHEQNDIDSGIKQEKNRDVRLMFSPVMDEIGVSVKIESEGICNADVSKSGRAKELSFDEAMEDEDKDRTKRSRKKKKKTKRIVEMQEERCKEFESTDVSIDGDSDLREAKIVKVAGHSSGGANDGDEEDVGENEQKKKKKKKKKKKDNNDVEMDTCDVSPQLPLKKKDLSNCSILSFYKPLNPKKSEAAPRPDIDSVDCSKQSSADVSEQANNVAAIKKGEQENDPDSFGNNMTTDDVVGFKTVLAHDVGAKLARVDFERQQEKITAKAGDILEKERCVSKRKRFLKIACDDVLVENPALSSSLRRSKRIKLNDSLTADDSTQIVDKLDDLVEDGNAVSVGETVKDAGSCQLLVGLKSDKLEVGQYSDASDEDDPAMKIHRQNASLLCLENEDEPRYGEDEPRCDEDGTTKVKLEELDHNDTASVLESSSRINDLRNMVNATKEDCVEIIESSSGKVTGLDIVVSDSLKNCENNKTGSGLKRKRAMSSNVVEDVAKDGGERRRSKRVKEREKKLEDLAVEEVGRSLHGLCPEKKKKNKKKISGVKENLIEGDSNGSKHAKVGLEGNLKSAVNDEKGAFLKECEEVKEGKLEPGIKDRPRKIVTEEEPITEEYVNRSLQWTDKYSPQKHDDVIGSKESVFRLFDWLSDWKVKHERFARMLNLNATKRRRRKKYNDDTDSDGDFRDSSDEESDLSNTFVIIGKPGCGSTAAVYACAQELGYKVLELNTSMYRTGKQIQSLLGEATQSHQVKRKFHGSTFASNDPEADNDLKGVRKLSSFFGTKTTDSNSEEKRLGAANDDREVKETRGADSKTREDSCSSKAADDMSVILFEQADLVFDDLDKGFWLGVNELRSQAKRPIVLTTNDPCIVNQLDGHAVEVINMNYPTKSEAIIHLQVLCLAEQVYPSESLLDRIITSCNCNIGQCIMQLQFWLEHWKGPLYKLIDGGATCKDGGKSSLRSVEAGNTEQGSGIVELVKSESNVLGENCGNVEQDKRPINQDRQSINQDKQSIDQDKQSINQDEQSTNQDKQSIHQDKQSINQDEQSVNQDKQSIDHDKQSINQDEQSVNQDKQSIDHDKQSINQDKQSFQPGLDNTYRIDGGLLKRNDGEDSCIEQSFKDQTNEEQSIAKPEDTKQNDNQTPVDDEGFLTVHKKESLLHNLNKGKSEIMVEVVNADRFKFCQEEPCLIDANKVDFQQMVKKSSVFTPPYYTPVSKKWDRKLNEISRTSDLDLISASFDVLSDADTCKSGKEYSPEPFGWWSCKIKDGLVDCLSTTTFVNTQNEVMEELYGQVKLAGSKLQQVSLQKLGSQDASHSLIGNGCVTDTLASTERCLPLTNKLDHRSSTMDVIPSLKLICALEENRRLTQFKRRTRRFLHYLDGIFLHIDSDLNEKLLKSSLKN